MLELIALLGATLAAAGDRYAACAALPKDAERLICYDALASEPTPPISEFAARCEAGIIAKLQSPAGYRRVSIEETTSPSPLDEWVEQELYRIRDRNLQTPDKAVAEREVLREAEVRLRAAGQTPIRRLVTVTFDAPNSFNALLRSTETCERVDVPD